VDSIERPIFLVASVRSGTTLLSVILAHNPDIAFPGEFELSVDLIGPDGQLPEMADYHEWLRVDRHFLWHKLEIDPRLDYPALVRSFLSQMKQEGNGGPKAHVGASVHRGFEHLVDLWPEARFIHLLRDPRDVGASIMVEGWAGNHYTGAEKWRESEESWDRLRDKLQPDQWIEISFEELASQHIETLTRVCEFIGVPYREEMMDYAKNTTYSKVDSRVRERWRNNQTPQEIQLGEAGAGDMLERRGYSLSGQPKLMSTPLRAKWLALHCLLVRLRWRLQRYGLRLWIERRLAHALGIARWEESITLREHEITNRHLK